ncbi:MAG: hypothetical protein ACR2JB_24930 [Bryobacteraceae bacterium]
MLIKNEIILESEVCAPQALNNMVTTAQTDNADTKKILAHPKNRLILAIARSKLPFTIETSPYHLRFQPRG